MNCVRLVDSARVASPLTLTARYTQRLVENILILTGGGVSSVPLLNSDF
ncbi:hypothetical protein NSTC731_01243 [Nostoc sp. DSM 114167]|jgi:hypothetical protein